jgi:pimeloyl-ACP methyl ester carboxylesterase
MSHDPTQSEPVTSRRGFFWVGAERVSMPFGTVVRGPMFVYWEAPVEITRPHPIVLIHGGGGQGLDWMGTPDGRPGWLTYLVEEGWVVYVVDRPGHGRSSYHPDVMGPMGAPLPFEAGKMIFDPPEGAHPTADRHDQWPGDHGDEDPALAAFIIAGGPMTADLAVGQELDRSRGAELLDEIGPAILVTSSLGGPAGWLIADERPDLVKAIVALEAIGPPFAVQEQLGLSLDWGLTQAPITFDPPASEASEIQRVTHDPPEEGGIPLELQADPPRRLPNLADIPVAIVSSEASPFLHFGDHMVAFLRQAGVDAEHVRLADHGVKGNGHGMMVERNNREVLDVVLRWLDEHVSG